AAAPGLPSLSCTTLFRSQAAHRLDLDVRLIAADEPAEPRAGERAAQRLLVAVPFDRDVEPRAVRGLLQGDRGGVLLHADEHVHRSEEHTSELQSRENLLC